MLRQVTRVAVVAGIVTACVAIGGSPGNAQGQGVNCRATFAGVDVAQHASPGSPIKVTRDTTTTVEATSTGPLSAYTIRMQYWRIGWNVAQGSINPPDIRWSRSVDVRKYAKYGVGLYRVGAIGGGSLGSCTKIFYVRVEGNPLDTTAGKAAAASGGIGAVLLVGEAIAAANDEQKKLDEQYKKDVEQAEADEARRKAVDAIANAGDGGPSCGFLAITAFLMTASVMVSGHGGTAAASTVALPQVRRRWRLSVLGLVSGLLLGLGTLVLLQQYAVAYPTDIVTVLTVGGALVLGGVVVPTFRRHQARTQWVARALATLPAAVPAAEAPVAAPSWSPTHDVPEGGLPTYLDHDTTQSAGEALVASLPVQVVETWGDWSRVRCENDWECWVDGRLLVAR